MIFFKKIRSKILNYWYKFLAKHPFSCIQGLRMYFGPKRMNLSTLDHLIIPKSITGFHDLYYLFACHQANRGIIAQDFDEAAYIWKIITEKQPGEIFEIGRWLGGSTVLLCAAASQYEGGTVISVDLKTKEPHYAKDSIIKKHLQKLGLSNYKLYVASSFDFNPGCKMDFVFIDGDHSYEGVKKDFNNIEKYLSVGADILFHDSCATRQFATIHEGVDRLICEIRENNQYSLIRQIGSITHFQF